MDFKKISAIVRGTRLEAVEKRLQELGVPGISVTEMKGFGEYANFFRRDWFSREVKIEIFCSEDSVEKIVSGIIETVRTGTRGDGIIAVLPVDKVFNVRTGAPAGPASLRCREQ